MAIDETKIAFSSDRAIDYQKIALQGKLSVSIPSQTWDFNTEPIIYTTVTVPHTLGFIPTARVFYDGVNSIQMAPFPSPFGDNFGSVPTTGTVVTSAASPFCSVYVSTTALTLKIANRSGSTKSYNLYYRLYYDAV